jgi:glucose-6-phosphate isomerase
MAENNVSVPASDAEYLEFLSMDFNNLTSEALGEGKGLDQAEFSELKRLAAEAYEDVMTRYRTGLLPFMDLPKDMETLKAVKKLGESVRRKFDTVVVLGIGGSALGTSAVFTALRPFNQNYHTETKSAWPRLIVADNIDPEGFNSILERVDLNKTFFNVISKSGATAETMSQFMIIHDLLMKTLGKTFTKEKLLVTTDPQNGVLRKIVDSDGLTSLSIPPGVGGRFSVLTAVGLAPLAMGGCNVGDLLFGAQKAQEDAEKPEGKGQAYYFACLNYLLNTVKKKSALVMMPYSDALSRIADWFGQLWNESLGKAVKLDGKPNPYSLTAYKALGATDQHSQLQMYMEGGDEKIICFVGTENFRQRLNIPPIFKEHEELSYLGGHSLAELINSERQGTARALTENGKANFSLTLSKINSITVGYLLHTLEVATVVAGHLYGINPLDQPGVELGKKFTYGLMGRPGFGEYLDRFVAGQLGKPRFIVKNGAMVPLRRNPPEPGPGQGPGPAK